MNWYVIYTKSRYEKAVAQRIALAGAEIYCPLLKRKKLWSDRWKWVEEPLFRSYCFVRVEERETEKILLVPGVVRFVYHCGKAAIMRDKEMEILKEWLTQYGHEKIEVGAFSQNDRIRIRSGALMNREGMVLEKNNNYALLFLENIGLHVKIDLSKNLVEKL